MANIVQQLSRTPHTSSSGLEIEREFYVEPYSHHVAVIKALQGSVARKGGEGDDATDWERTPPAHDPYIENAYCVETRTPFVDSRVNATADSLIETADEDLLLTLQRRRDPKAGTAGVKITAKYRPLITAWEDDESTEAKQIRDQHKTERWDWIDPQFVPGIRQIPWPDGLFIEAPAVGPPVVPFLVGGLPALAVAAQTINVPDTVASPFGVPIIDFNIKRLFIGEVPWDVIGAAANAVNKNAFPPANTPPRESLPTFPPRTLKFVGANVRTMIDAGGLRWFEVTLNFQWIHLFSPKVFDDKGNATQAAGPDGPLGGNWVTWNHVYMRPGRLGINREIGWYEVFRGKQRAIAGFNVGIPGLAAREGRLHHEVDMIPLFQLNP